jgi:hypothetical protein
MARRTAVGLDGGLAWSPDVPDGALAERPIEDPHWAMWMEGQGYTGQEIRRHLPDLIGYVRRTLAEREVSDVVTLPRVVAGLVVAFLVDRPPLVVLEMDPRPSQFLGPADMGARLRPAPNGWRDVLTGGAWAVSAERGPSAAAQVVAAALYRKLGVLTYPVRLVELDGERRAAWPSPAPWTWRPAPDIERPLLEIEIARLRLEAPVDVWLGTGVRPRVHLRDEPHELTGTTCRSDLRSVLGWLDGDAASGWPGKPALDLPRWGPYAGMQRAAWSTMADRVAALPIGAMEAAIALGGGNATEAATLLGALIARRGALAAAIAV